jgi:competence protein ComEC
VGVGLRPQIRDVAASIARQRRFGVPSPSRLVRWLGRSVLAERFRWPLWLPVGLGAGIAIYFALPVEPAWPIALAIGALSAVAGAGSVWARGLARAGLGLVAVITLGFFVAKSREELVSGPVLHRPVGPIRFEGHVVDAQAHGRGVRVVVSGVRLPSVDDEIVDRLRVTFRSGAENLKPGDVIGGTAMLMPPPGPTEPGAFDFGRAAYFDGLGAVGYAYGRPQLRERVPPRLADDVADRIGRLRARMTARIHAVLPGSIGSIGSALITGDRGGITDQDEQALRDAGLAHVLAIAGLHMALVGLGLFWTIRASLAAWPAIALNYPIKKWAAAAALAGAAFYLVISGAAAPTVRAFTMLAMMLVAIMLDRPALSMRSVALAAVIVLFMAPESLVEPGFQMSFAAVVGLIAVAEWEQSRGRQNDSTIRHRSSVVRRYLRGIAMTSFVGSIATLPFAIFHFDRATHYAVLGNLLAMPIMGFVTMPAAALSVVAMPFGLEGVPLRVMGFGIAAMLAVGRWVSSLPGAASVVSAWPVAALGLISFGGLWCAIWQRNWRLLGLAPLALGVLLAFQASGPDLIVGRDAETIAVRGADGSLHLMRATRDNYSADDWLKRDGDERLSADAIATPADGVHCDGYGCIAKSANGMLIAAPFRAEALWEDCARATILISALPIESSCWGPSIVLDRTAISRKGGFAIWLSPLRVVSVKSARGERPWSVAGWEQADD